MGITYIPSPAEGISKSLDTLVQGLDKYINPNKDLQNAVKRAMATNPQLLQQLGDLEKAAPGTMAQMGLGRVGDIIASVPQSAAGAKEVASRPGAAKAAVAEQGAQTTQNEIVGQIGTTIQDMIKKNPALANDAGMQKLLGMTQGQYDVEAAKNPLAIATAQTQLKSVLRARGLPEDLSKVDFTKEARDFLDGKLDGGTAAAYVNPLNPDSREAFHLAVQGELATRQAAAQRTLVSMRADERQNFRQAHDNFKMQKAFQMYYASGGVADPQTWEDLMYDPDTKKRAKELLAGGTPKNDKEKMLLDVAKKNQVDIGNDDLNEVLKINKGVTAELDQMNKADDPKVRDRHMEDLNALLAKRATHGGAEIEARFVPGRFFGGDVQFFDKKTNTQLEPGKVMATLADPNAGDVFKPMSSAGQRVMSAMIDAQTNNKIGLDAQLAKMKADEKTAGLDNSVSSEVEAELIRKGLIQPRVGAKK